MSGAFTSKPRLIVVPRPAGTSQWANRRIVTVAAGSSTQLDGAFDDSRSRKLRQDLVAAGIKTLCIAAPVVGFPLAAVAAVSSGGGGGSGYGGGGRGGGDGDDDPDDDDDYGEDEDPEALEDEESLEQDEGDEEEEEGDDGSRASDAGGQAHCMCPHHGCQAEAAWVSMFA